MLNTRYAFALLLFDLVFFYLLPIYHVKLDYSYLHIVMTYFTALVWYCKVKYLYSCRGFAGIKVVIAAFAAILMSGEIFSCFVEYTLVCVIHFFHLIIISFTIIIDSRLNCKQYSYRNIISRLLYLCRSIIECYISTKKANLT